MQAVFSQVTVYVIVWTGFNPRQNRLNFLNGNCLKIFKTGSHLRACFLYEASPVGKGSEGI
jgi:hypothetical protein